MNISSCLAWLCVLLVASTATCASASDVSRGSIQLADETAHQMTLKEILQRNLDAVRVKPSDRTTVNTDKILRIDEAGHSLVARYRATSNGFVRIDVFDDAKRVFSEGKDSMGVWEWPAGKDAPENVSNEGAEALEHGIEFNLFPLAELPNRGHRIELVGNESVGDKWYFVLKVKMSDGFETYRYVNAETWLVDISRDFRAFHPGIDSTKKNIETRYDRWTQACGVLFASRSRNVDLDTGEVIATTLVLESRYNRPGEELDLARNYVPIGVPQPSDQGHGASACR